MSKHTNIDHLKSKKIKLTFIFTLIVFIVLMISEVSFLAFKFISYKNLEVGKLNESTNKASNFIDNDDRGIKWYNRFRFEKENPMPISLPRPWARDEQFLFFNWTWNIIFSSVGNENFEQSLINSILWNKIKQSDYSFEYSGVEFLYSLKNFAEDDGPARHLIIFTIRTISFSDILLEFVNYFVLSLILCAALYFLIYKFISYTLKPVEDNIKDMEQFIYNAWHELKTPLAVVSSHLQLAKFSKKYSEAIDDSIAELNRINSLIEVLIEFSTIKQELKDSTFLVNDVVKDIAKKYQSKLDEKNIKLNIREVSQTNLTSNQEHFEILISNLISNAIKYNNEWWEIIITVDKKSVEVKDTWIWISQENLDKIFERFYQENPARNQEWFGIWLSLVKKITWIYGWKIDITSEKEKGTAIKIIF